MTLQSWAGQTGKKVKLLGNAALMAIDGEFAQSENPNSGWASLDFWAHLMSGGSRIVPPNVTPRHSLIMTEISNIKSILQVVSNHAQATRSAPERWPPIPKLFKHTTTMIESFQSFVRTWLKQCKGKAKEQKTDHTNTTLRQWYEYKAIMSRYKKMIPDVSSTTAANRVVYHHKEESRHKDVTESPDEEEGKDESESARGTPNPYISEMSIRERQLMRSHHREQEVENEDNTNDDDDTQYDDDTNDKDDMSDEDSANSWHDSHTRNDAVTGAMDEIVVDLTRDVQASHVFYNRGQARSGEDNDVHHDQAPRIKDKNTAMEGGKIVCQSVMSEREASLTEEWNMDIGLDISRW